MTVKEQIILTASYYRIAISEPVLEMYAEDLDDLNPQAVIAAYKAFRKNPKNKQMPLPAQIRELIEPTVNHDAKAREIASRIPAAIVKFGWANPAEAQKFIGEVGWNIVQSSGGWSYLCQNHGVTMDPGQFMAQTRDRLKDQFEYGREAINAQVIEHRPKAEVLQIEAARQKEEYAKHLASTEKAMPDPNADYVALSPEERDQVIQKFLANIKQV